MAKCEAMAIVLDVSPSMTQAAEGGQTALQKSIAAINMIIQRRIFSESSVKSKSEACIILFGTDGTANPLNDGSDSGGYDHITLCQELSVMDVEMLKFVNSQITPGGADGDFVDALVVAMDHLRTKTMGRKMEQKIVLFSDMASEFGDDQIDMIVNGLKNTSTSLIFVGPEVDEDEDEQPNRNQADRKALSPQQEQGVKCMRYILEEVDGEGMSIDEILPMLSFFEKRRKKQTTTFRGPIEIGSTLKINVFMYAKTKEEKPTTWKKLSALAEVAACRDTMAVTMERSYHLNDVDQTEVDKENTAKAYRYGKTLVPLTKDDTDSFKCTEPKSCYVLGFTDKENVHPSQYSLDGSYCFVPQPDDEHAAVAFSAFCHALEEKGVVAIIRLKTQKNYNPKIGFLVPHIKSKHESLTFVALPFNEDLRQYMFSSLDTEKNKPSDEQLIAVDGLIDGMNLIHEDISEDDDVVELFKPRETLNPVIQRQCQCVLSRVLDPEEIRIPEIEEYIIKCVKAVPEMINSCQASFSRIQDLFPLQTVETKKMGTAVNMFQTSTINDEPEAKKPKIQDGEEGFTFASLSRNQITEVGTVSPEQDFEHLVDNADSEKFKEACSQLKSRILTFVHDSFLNQQYPKAVSCFKILRKHSIQRHDAPIYNDLLKQLREETEGNARRNDFWELIKTDAGMRLISSIEDASSAVSENEAQNFFSNDEVKSQNIVEPTDDFEDVDDLLDMM